jgi:hypothetical protein
LSNSQTTIFVYIFLGGVTFLYPTGTTEYNPGSQIELLGLGECNQTWNPGLLDKGVLTREAPNLGILHLDTFNMTRDTLS